MNKAGKHIQSGGGGGGGIGIGMGSPIGIGNSVLTTSSPNNNNASANANNSSPGQAAQKNVFNSIMSFLPDNRPITSLQIVEDYEKCPKNFTPVHRTYDQDSDADLWRENNILFGRQTTRYLCLSKTEGLPEYVVETLKVIAEKIQPPKEFSLLSRTADSEQKAWRKRQIAYKLSKRGTVTQAVTDIILCAKLKIAPEGFKLAGDINGVLVCFKTGAIPVRLPPPVPLAGMQSPPQQQVNGGSEVEKALNRLNLSGGSTAISWSPHQPLPPVPNDIEHDYEEIEGGFHLSSPRRPAPPRPPPHGAVTSTATNTSLQSVGTLGSYTELDGVPFVVNPALRLATQNELFKLPQHISAEKLKTLDYDFQMERQILCTMKSSASKNPFFK